MVSESAVEILTVRSGVMVELHLVFSNTNIHVWPELI